jgi:cellulose synthase/poly-beta-1,6-N-acetylglucosamine synthase-like glycosyltransferase
MNTVWQPALWLAAILLAYVYFGYPAMLLLLARFRAATTTPANQDCELTVSLIVAAHNEDRVIADKIENSLALDYPRDKLDIIVASDGSTDRTAEVARAYASYGVEVIELRSNLGKAYAENGARQRANGDVLLFSDANAFLQRNAVRQLVARFRDGRVGCVFGKVTYLNQGETGVSEGEGLYWRYELFLRRLESSVGNLVAGSGPIMAVRRTLFEPLDPAVSEDFFLPMRTAMRGYRTVFEPAAVSSERLYQVTPRDMLKTRIRTTTLDTRSLFLCRALLNPFCYPLYSWGLISHKLLRWLVPYFLIALFVANLLLLDQTFYRFTLAPQVVCYALAGAGYLWQRTGRKPPRLLGIPFSFCLVNAAAAVGVARFLMGKKSGSWTPVRETASQ